MSYGVVSAGNALWLSRRANASATGSVTLSSLKHVLNGSSSAPSAHSATTSAKWASLPPIENVTSPVSGSSQSSCGGSPQDSSCAAL